MLNSKLVFKMACAQRALSHSQLELCAKRFSIILLLSAKTRFKLNSIAVAAAKRSENKRIHTQNQR